MIKSSAEAPKSDEETQPEGATLGVAPDEEAPPAEPTPENPEAPTE